MKAQFTIFSVNHYDMEQGKGLSVRVLGENVKTNNKFGVEVSEAAVLDYNELQYLQRFGEHLPAKFNADFSISTIKAGNGKERSGVVLKNLEFVTSVELVEKKTLVKS